MSKLVLQSKGLAIAPGELSRAPGALVQADNVNVEAPGVIRSRNGFAAQANKFGGPSWKFASTKELGSNLLMNTGGANSASGLKYGDGSGVATSISGTVTNQPATRMQVAVSKRNHYVTSDEGVRRIESDMSMSFAGMPKGLCLDLTGPGAVLVRTLNYDGGTGAFTLGLTATGGSSGATAKVRAIAGGTAVGRLAVSAVSGAFTDNEAITDSSTGAAVVNGTIQAGFIADGSSVAYRVTWCKKDVEGIVMEGAPTARTVIYNNTRTTGWASGVAQDALCRILLPKQAITASTALTTSYFYRLYRSEVAAAGIIPSDDMNLVAEAYLTSGNISAGYVEVADSTPEAFRLNSPPLYTNQNGGGDVGVGGAGFEQSNFPPPRARDVALFAECLFYSDLTYLQAFDFTILSTVPGVGVTAADTLTIGAIVYTAVASGATPGNNEFRVITSTGVTDTTNSEAIERTAQNLVEAINKSSTNTTTWAFYASGPNELPGKIHLESRQGIIFQVQSSAHGTSYRPDITNNPISLADTFANGFCFSKPAQGDAVPSANVGFIGRNDTALLRMQVLRDSIYFFTDAGLYRLTGRTFDDFDVQEFDLTFRLIGREMVTTCDDYIYAWGYEGIAKISSAGVEYISNPIEPMLWDIINTIGLTWMAGYSWATSFRSRHKVVFAVPLSNSSNNAGNCPYFLVYDTRMQAWTRWVFLAGNDADRTQGHSCGAVRVSDDLLFLGQWNHASSDSSIFKERRAFAAADYKDDTFNTTNEAITKTVKWNAVADSPELSTHWDEAHLLYDVSPTFSAWTTPTALTVTFTSDFGQSSAANAVAPTALSRMSRASVPMAQRRSVRQTVTVSHATASEYFGLEGMVLVHLPGEGTATVRT